MRTSLLPFLCLLLCSLQATAQQKFAGYYINHEGDTTRVSLPDYKQWKNNPGQIDVLTADGEARVLTPSNTRQVTIEGYDTYRSRHFSRLTNPYSNTSDFSVLSAVDTLEELDGFLLLVAEGGGVSLYQYRDKKRENFFIEKEGHLTELKHKAYLSDDRSQVMYDNRFRQQLFVAFNSAGNSDKAMAGKLEKLDYNEEQLEAFVRNAGGTKVKKPKRYPSGVMLMGGTAINTFKVTSESFNTASTMTDYKASVAPVIGIAFYDYSQRNFGRNFFTLQLTYYRFKNSGDYTYYNRPGKMTYQSSVIDFGMGLGRNFIQTPSLTAYAALLPGMMFLPDSKEINSGIDKEVKETMLTINASLQAGLRFANRLGVWARYRLRPVDTQQYVYYANYHRSIQVGVDWNLKK